VIRVHQFWLQLKKSVLWIDRIIEGFALSGLAAMALIVTMQVITRKGFNFVFFWSEEVTLLLLVWFSVIGIAIGFRERLHLAMTSFTNLFSDRMNVILTKIICICIFMFGLYLVVYGWDFTSKMYNNTLAATGWSLSVRYAVMPISGVMICFYAILDLAGVKIERHQVDEEEAST
jgi:TRAP-type transport system small permease protein